MNHSLIANFESVKLYWEAPTFPFPLVFQSNDLYQLFSNEETNEANIKAPTNFCMSSLR